MTLASGDGAAFQFTSGFVASRLAFNATSSPTVFAPQTAGDESLERWEGNSTFMSRLTSVFPTSTDVSATPMLTSSAADANGKSVFIIIGAVCGVAGLILGIVITAVLWTCKYKRKPASASCARKAPVLKKNPREMTFEPLDLTLTRPAYETAPSVAEFERKSATSRKGTCSSVSAFEISENVSYRSFNTLPSLSHHQPKNEDRFCNDSATDELSERETSYVTKIQLENNRNETSSCSSRTTKSSRPSSVNKKWEKQPSHSARGSISSGLGTGTESDISPYESRNACLPVSECISETQYDNHSSLDLSKSPKGELTRRCRSSSALPASRAPAVGRKSKWTTMPGNRVKRTSLKSDTSSSCASSGATSSVGEWIPAATIVPTTTNLSSPSSPPPNDDFNERTPDEESSTTSSGGERSKRDDDNCCDAKANNEVVSTYFDLRFPLPSHKSEQGVEMEKGNGNPLYRTSERTVDNADDVIEL